MPRYLFAILWSIFFPKSQKVCLFRRFLCVVFFYKAITYFDICLLCFLSEMQLINITLVSTERTTNNASVCRCNSQCCYCCCCDGRLCRLQSNHVAGLRPTIRRVICQPCCVIAKESDARTHRSDQKHVFFYDIPLFC